MGPERLNTLMHTNEDFEHNGNIINPENMQNQANSTQRVMKNNYIEDNNHSFKSDKTDIDTFYIELDKIYGLENYTDPDSLVQKWRKITTDYKWIEAYLYNKRLPYVQTDKSTELEQSRYNDAITKVKEIQEAIFQVWGYQSRNDLSNHEHKSNISYGFSSPDKVNESPKIDRSSNEKSNVDVQQPAKSVNFGQPTILNNPKNASFQNQIVNSKSLKMNKKSVS